MRIVRDIPILENIPVLVRAPLNVPIEDGVVADTYRLERALPTIKFLAEHRARVILISHIGEQGTETLEPVAKALGELVRGVSFCPQTIGPSARTAIRGLLPGNVLVLENLRRDRGEKNNDPAFAKELASLADVFVEDSFDTCHRVHASIVGVPALLPSYAGLLLEEEVIALTKALSPEHPALAVIGGAKFATKEPVLTALLAGYDRVFVGGALADDFLAASGKEVGKSLVSNDGRDEIVELLKNPKLALPLDARVVKANDTHAPTRARIVSVDHVSSDDVMLDDGPATSSMLADLAKGTKSILWNGPLGEYERGFVEATDDFARAVAASGAHSVVGGGDTVASIQSLGLLPRFSFVSTGGGAMLEFLAHGTLPGIAALDSHS